MAVFSCDICGKWYWPGRGDLKRFKQPQYLHVNLPPPPKEDKIICKSCFFTRNGSRRGM